MPNGDLIFQVKAAIKKTPRGCSSKKKGKAYPQKSVRKISLKKKSDGKIGNVFPRCFQISPIWCFFVWFPYIPCHFNPREPRQSLPRSASSLPRSKFTGGFPTGKCHGKQRANRQRKNAPLSSSSMGPNSPKHHPLPVSHPLPKKFTHQKKKIAKACSAKVFLTKAKWLKDIFQSQRITGEVTLESPKTQKQTLQNDSIFCPEGLHSFKTQVALKSSSTSFGVSMKKHVTKALRPTMAAKHQYAVSNTNSLITYTYSYTIYLYTYINYQHT